MKLLGKRGLLKDVEIVLRLSDCYGLGHCFQWNKTLNQLEMKGVKQQLILKRKLVIAAVYFVLSLIQLIRVYKTASSMVVTHSILFKVGMVLLLSCELANYMHLSGVVKLCNSFIQFEQKFSKEFEIDNFGYGRKSCYVRGMIYFLTMSGLGSIVFFLDILRNPCFPAFVGYWMSNQCEIDKPGYYREPDWSFVEVFTKLGIATVATSVWTPFAIESLFQMALQYVMEGNCFRVDIEEFGNKLLQTNPEDNSDLKKLTLFHRQLQIMSIHYRLYHSQFQIVCAILSAIGTQMACLYNSILVLSGKDTGGPIWYDLMYAWCTVLTVAAIILMFGILANVHTVSEATHVTVNGRHELKRNNWFWRWLKSCPVVKIYFGGSNYLDCLSPLNIQNFAIDQTVSLMLLQ